MTAGDLAELVERVHLLEGRPWRRALVARASFAERLDGVAASRPASPAITSISAEGNVATTLTYAELAGAVAAEAARLGAGGVGTGDIVGVAVQNTPRHVITVLATVRLGATAVVVDANEPADRCEEMLTTLSSFRIDEAGAVRSIRARPAALHQPRGRNTALILFTTGSTASSKAVAQSEYSVVLNAVAVARHHRIGAGSTLACPLPVSHVNGLEFGVIAPLMVGAHSVLFEAFDALSFLRVLDRSGADVVTTVPSVLRAVADLPRWPRLANLRHFVSAAAALDPGLANAVADRSGKRIVQGYGLSECMNFATTMPLAIGGADYERLVLRADIPPVGVPMLGCEVTVQSPSGRQLEEGEVGEVCIRGHSLMTEYVGNPDATREVFRGGWLRTGDLGRLATDAACGGRALLTLVGRSKLVAKCAGRSVSLEEIEREALRLGAREACAVARPHRRLVEAVTLYYAGASDETARAAAARVVDPAAVDLLVEGVERLPRLRSGKPDRRSLAEAAAASAASAAAPPRRLRG